MSFVRMASRLAIVLSCVVSASVTTGCADEEPASEGDDAPLTGDEIVRGVLGVERGAQGTNEARAANAIVAEIDKQFPGRIKQIETELKSRDGDRIQAAKRLLDETIDAAANGPAFGGDGRIGSSLIEAKGIRFLDGLANGGTSLVDGESELVCSAPRAPNGDDLVLGRGADGRFGDDRTGASGAFLDNADLVDTDNLWLPSALNKIDDGELVPDPESRLGAYAATRGYPPGTVGHAVHNAIGTIYLALANYGEENIGRVFNSPEALALYGQPVDSCAGYQMAMLEHAYWSAVRAEDPFSPGGNLGSMFNPRARDLLQRRVFGP